MIRSSVAAGVDSIVVDWENQGKLERQSGRDTEINSHTVQDLRLVRAATSAKVICRINAFDEYTPLEVEYAVMGGADEILLPMVRRPEELAQTIAMAAGRCGVGLMVETSDAIQCAGELGRFELSRVYVGLHDLSIDRATPNLFTPLIDGTLESLRPHFRAPFGFGGLTLPERGSPIPCRLLMGEMARLRCSHSFLRRSFWADTAGRDLKVELPRIQAALMAAGNRSSGQIQQDREELVEAVRNWNGDAAASS